MKLCSVARSTAVLSHNSVPSKSICKSMTSGRVIDAGAPADLVERHASTATIRFSMPDPPVAFLDQVRQLDGVREVERAGRLITVRGHRRIIAYVGAALVRWEPVPADLTVHCRVLAPGDRLRYSPGSLLIVASASLDERDRFLTRLIEDRASMLSLGKVRAQVRSA